MARGDECKTASKANHACKQFGIASPDKKQAQTFSSYEKKKVEPKKNYGSWGPVFKDKKTFTDMHFC